MKAAFFGSYRFDRDAFERIVGDYGHKFQYFKANLYEDTADLARDNEAVCVFVHDNVNAETIKRLAGHGIKLIALRCAGFNNVDLKAAAEHGIKVVRVPEYSPHAVAEHALALLQGLNRKIPRAYGRVRDGNFSLDGLVGFDLHGKTIGIIGTGKIGAEFTRIMSGFGCKLLAYDIREVEELKQTTKVQYTSLDDLFSQSDIISLHVPLFPETQHIINAESIAKMKKGVFIINTSRGGLIQTSALIDALKSGQVGAAALDVYEEEDNFFFRDFSGQIIHDDILARLLTFPNVIITSHQAFLTYEALDAIAQTTLENMSNFEQGKPLPNEVKAKD